MRPVYPAGTPLVALFGPDWLVWRCPLTRGSCCKVENRTTPKIPQKLILADLRSTPAPASVGSCVAGAVHSINNGMMHRSNRRILSTTS